jgi:hypothetical protein
VEKYIEAYNNLNLYEKKEILSLIMHNDVCVFFEGSRELKQIEYLADPEDISVNGTQIQITVRK